jgi:hypothetical protein
MTKNELQGFLIGLIATVIVIIIAVLIVLFLK